MASPLGPSPRPPADRTNIGEVAGGKAAEQSASTEAVRMLGKRYADNHTTNEHKLEALAMRLGVTLRTASTER